MSVSANLKIQHYRLTYRLMQLLTATNIICVLSLVTAKRLFMLSRWVALHSRVLMSREVL